jgi:predicted flap endonuclease-1-like 5' DNA nuclease
MGTYLKDEVVEQVIEAYLDRAPDGQQLRAGQEEVSQLRARLGEIARQVEDVLARCQALGGGDERELALLYGLLKRLPVLVFEPVNYCFVGRVAIPLENVLDLLIHLDVYAGGQPVYRGPLPGVLQFTPLVEQGGEGVTETVQSVIDIAGIGPIYSTLLREQAGVRTTQDLSERGATPQGRAELARQTGLSEKLLTRWARRADLMRVEGIGAEYGELLESGGVKGVAELARRNAENLHQALKRTNAERRLVQRLPSLEEVRGWIGRAKQLT